MSRVPTSPRSLTIKAALGLLVYLGLVWFAARRLGLPVVTPGELVGPVPAV